MEEFVADHKSAFTEGEDGVKKVGEAEYVYRITVNKVDEGEFTEPGLFSVSIFVKLKNPDAQSGVRVKDSTISLSTLIYGNGS